MKTTISNIAGRAGISQGFFSNILCGRRRPHYKTAKKIAAITGTTVELWLEGSEQAMRKAVQEAA